MLTSVVLIQQGTGILEADWRRLIHSGSEGCWLKISALFLVVTYSLTFRRFFIGCIFPVCVLMALYFPIGVNFGLPNVGQVVSAFNTDWLEAQEFLWMIPVWQFAVPPAIIVMLLASWWLVRRLSLTCFMSPVFVLVTALTVVYFAGDLRFLTQGWRYVKEVTVGMKELAAIKTVPTVWRVTVAHPKYRNYVLVVGESNRRDYMHAYGYPIENTPFMESRGRLLEGMTSVADYTIPSLQKALTKTRVGEPVNHALSTVDLAKVAGFATYWFSNQGHIDKKNTPITALADRADTKFWVKQGARADENTSDLELLPLVTAALEKTKGEEGNRFFVLHLMGSHASVCERIHVPFAKPVVGDAGREDAYCYETTMRQTDYFLQQLDAVMRSAGESYSILYFADHGVSHNNVRGKLVMNHANPANHHRDVPLYCVSSDDEGLVRVKARRYLSNLTEGVSAWLGVATEQLPQPRELFRNEDDTDEYGVTQELLHRRDDPVMVVQSP